ncbi:MAG: glycosyltransferase family 8 protein [Actinomycetales bacterium]|nr:glycosyltransferase family 8 protein [Actinomycetales bacterium]
MTNSPVKSLARKARNVAKRVAGQGDSKQAAMYRSMVNRERDRVRDLRAERDSLAKQLQQAKSGELLLDLVNSGQEFEPAFMEFVRQSHAFTNRMKTRAFTHALMEDEKYQPLGLMGFGVFLVNEELYESAFSYFEKAGTELALELAPVEYFLSMFSVQPEAATNRLTEYLNGSRSKIDRNTHLALVKSFVKYMKIKQVQAEVQFLIDAETADPQLDEEGTQLVQWLQKHLSNVDSPAPVLEPGTISLAVMDYKLLDRSRTSSNRGDYVQTLAALANVCRFTDVEFVGDSELAGLLNDLKADIKPERKLPGLAAKVFPTALDRDFSSGRQYPDNTWLVCNGWFMHTNYRGEMDFPFPDTVNPIFLSFHVNNPDVLTEEVAENLKKYEPIGCRDWTTVYRLHDFGVKAFFSGCLTTTVGQILPNADSKGKKRLAVVETSYHIEKYSAWEVEEFCQVGDYVRDFSLVDGIKDAKEMLENYVPFSKVITSRLHCYLPCRSMGLPVEFKPRNLSDVRFEGLLELDEVAYNKIRNGIEDKLEKMLAAIFSGKSKAEVMQLWQEICADDVAFAENYRTSYPPVPMSSVDVSQVLLDIKDQVVSFPGTNNKENATKLAFALDQNLKEPLAVVLQSIVDNMAEPADVHVLCRGLDQAYYQQLHDFFPEFNFFFYNFDLIDYGDKLRMLSHTTVSTMDRLFLPELLADLDKVLYLDVDILVRSDVAKLYNIDLGNNVIAGKRTKLKTWRNPVRLITRASLSLPPEEAWVLRRRLHDTVDLTKGTFNAGVLLLNLTAMRNEEFTKNHLYLIEHCAFNDQDVLNVYGGSRVLELGPEWNHVPNQDECEDPKIIHWAGPNKPWKEMYVWGKPAYNQIHQRLFGK